ncbi:hypothetical protein ACFCWY_08545 [Streptomyces sp. NPDC056362]|uniref:hypothetical protein n=1 Tax=unclassified Streptomyces TaxID=2593676 RepID=UPI0035E17E7B
MQNHPLDHAARVLAESDPVRRFHAAEAAAEAAAAPYRQAAEDALADLIAQHGGNMAAAARELGKTRQALYMRKNRTEQKDSARAGTEQVQPALRFDSPRASRDALLDWSLRQQEITDQLDVLLLGALAAGADPVDISEDSGVGLDTLRRIRPGANIVVSQLDEFGTEIEEFARAVTFRADALTAAADASGSWSAARIWRQAAQLIVTNAAPYALMPDTGIRREDFATEDEFLDALLEHEPSEEQKTEEQRQPSELATVSGADAWLAALYVSFRREAGREPSTTDETPEGAVAGEAIRAAFTELADHILHLRTTGQVPPALAARTA